MPRVESGAEFGLRIPGVDEALLEHEREKYYRRGESIVIEVVSCVFRLSPRP